MADRFLPPSEHPPTAQCARPNVCVVYVFNSRKNKILLFSLSLSLSLSISLLTIALTYLNTYFTFLLFYFLFYFFINSIPVRISTAYVATINALTSDDILTTRNYFIPTRNECIVYNWRQYFI